MKLSSNFIRHLLVISGIFMLDLLSSYILLVLVNYVPKQPYVIYFLIAPLYLYGTILPAVYLLLVYLKNENTDSSFKKVLDDSISWISTFMVSLAFLLTAGGIDVAKDGPLLFIVAVITTQLLLSNTIYDSMKYYFNTPKRIFYLFIVSTFIIIIIFLLFKYLYSLEILWKEVQNEKSIIITNIIKHYDHHIWMQQRKSCQRGN